MAYTFAKSDLLISDSELERIELALTSKDNPDPLTKLIAEQLAKVDHYTLKYDVPDADYDRLIRALVLYEAYCLIPGVVMPEAIKERYIDAMRELRDIRDGKHPDMALDDPAPDGLRDDLGSWGSSTKLDL